ncbi:hypothetical protein [[Mycobacterium] crassicus]|uniref:Uncharacterized protein n=1 Tax=[Mycobacterium] crassicus TaxID=2872309 RepID=A0ABU5XLP2_9MYCO|nr:hypothetical protein [Mycolicibacter sp. MYC098]MEB3022904.1 hypothetical protein [Mycolicibacter sp. MYC098]
MSARDLVTTLYLNDADRRALVRILAVAKSAAIDPDHDPADRLLDRLDHAHLKALEAARDTLIRKATAKASA